MTHDETPPDDLVELDAFYDANQAEIVRVALEEEGIDAVVEGQHQGGFTGILAARLLVRARDEERARAILQAHGNP